MLYVGPSQGFFAAMIPNLHAVTDFLFVIFSLSPLTLLMFRQAGKTFARQGARAMKSQVRFGSLSLHSKPSKIAELATAGLLSLGIAGVAAFMVTPPTKEQKLHFAVEDTKHIAHDAAHKIAHDKSLSEDVRDAAKATEKAISEINVHDATEDIIKAADDIAKEDPNVVIVEKVPSMEVVEQVVVNTVNLVAAGENIDAGAELQSQALEVTAEAAHGSTVGVLAAAQLDKALIDAKKNEPKQEGDGEGEQKGAYDPETGEINWDCPCLGGMAHGPCGEEFKVAFSCFVYSETEPKGIDCIQKFEGMRNCFKEHPEVYADELFEDDEPTTEQPKEQTQTKETKEIKETEESKQILSKESSHEKKKDIAEDMIIADEIAEE